MKQKTDDVDRQREWARWYEKARAAYLEEQRRRGGREIPWFELPLIPPPKRGCVMSRQSELVEDALAALRAQGIAATVEYGRHIKVRFVNSRGRQCLLVIAFSPSDRRAIKNSRAVLRQLLRRSA